MLLESPWLGRREVEHRPGGPSRRTRGGEVLRVAVIGANGFVGSRLVEQWHLEERADVVPIVRRPEAAASALRFALDCRVADALDERGLALCPRRLRRRRARGRGTAPVRHTEPGACGAGGGRAGARHRDLPELDGRSRLGRPAGDGRDDASAAPPTGPVQPLEGPRRAGAATAPAARPGLRFVILRPGIVYGPRSQWIAGFARAVADGSAYVVAGGRGVCNAIYVDNLVHAVDLALEREEAAGETFLVADDGARHLADALRAGLPRAREARGTRSPTSRRASPRLDARASVCSRSRTTRPLESCLDRVPRTLRTRSAAWPSVCPARSRPRAASRRAPLEDSILQTCGYRFPTAKARRAARLRAAGLFDEACRRTVGWLGFAGSPVAAATGGRPRWHRLSSRR